MQKMFTDEDGRLKKQGNNIGREQNKNVFDLT